jgi:hypothetical protein
VGYASDAAVSDLEFRRELTPHQIREALSLLDSTVGGHDEKFRIGASSPADEVNPKPPQSSTTATQDSPPAAEDPQQGKTHLKLAAVFFGIGIAATGALALLSWSESLLSPPMLVIPYEQAAKEAPAPPAKSVSYAPPVAKRPPDQSPGRSEQQPSPPERAGSRVMAYVNRGDDQAAVRDAANSGRAIRPGSRSAANLAIGTSQDRWDERVSRGPEYPWRHARTVRIAEAKKRFWRSHWQARAEINGAEWCFFGCRSWQAQRVFYEPPRNVRQ